MRVAYWDLETSNLEGDIGRLLCASILSDDGEMTTFRNDRIRAKKSMADDHTIAVRIRDELEKYHMTVGWFSKGFDIPFLNTRLAAYNERTLAPHFHFDPCWSMRGWRGLKTRNGKLKTAAEFFGLGERKMDVDVSVWIDAALGGDHDAMDILAERCESDVRILAKLSTKILDTGLVKNISRYP